MKKYYIEVYPTKYLEDKFENDYVIQSKWYDTEEEALQFAKALDYVDKDLFVALMSSEWDEENDCYINIDQERIINNI